MENRVPSIFALFLIALGLSACGPGSLDYESPILGGYSYVDNGGGESMIVLQRDDGRREIVVDARVDEYYVDQSTIYVARRPRMIFVEKGVPNSKISDKCEIYSIKVSEEVVESLESLAVHPSVACK